jgi:hypothetical protein
LQRSFLGKPLHVYHEVELRKRLSGAKSRLQTVGSIDLPAPHACFSSFPVKVFGNDATRREGNLDINNTFKTFNLFSAAISGTARALVKHWQTGRDNSTRKAPMSTMGHDVKRKFYMARACPDRQFSYSSLVRMVTANANSGIATWFSAFDAFGEITSPEAVTG